MSHQPGRAGRALCSRQGLTPPRALPSWAQGPSLGAQLGKGQQSESDGGTLVDVLTGAMHSLQTLTKTPLVAGTMSQYGHITRAGL